MRSQSPSPDGSLLETVSVDIVEVTNARNDEGGYSVTYRDRQGYRPRAVTCGRRWPTVHYVRRYRRTVAVPTAVPRFSSRSRSRSRLGETVGLPTCFVVASAVGRAIANPTVTLSPLSLRPRPIS